MKKAITIEVPVNDASYLSLLIEPGPGGVKLTRNVFFVKKRQTQGLIPDERTVTKTEERDRVDRILKSGSLTQEDKFVCLEALYFDPGSPFI